MKLYEMNVEELGRAYALLSGGEWPDWLDGKPEDYDELPAYAEDPAIRNKTDYDIDKMIQILSIIGAAEASWAWWRDELGRTESEWERWWCSIGEKEEREHPEMETLLAWKRQRSEQAEMSKHREKKRNGRNDDGDDREPNITPMLAIVLALQILLLLLKLVKF